MGNGRRWDERKGRDGPKWPAPARIRGEEKWGEKRAETDLNGAPLPIEKWKGKIKRCEIPRSIKIC